MINKEYIREYRKKRKLEALTLLGGCCINCGTTSNLEFDHIDPLTKINIISNMYTAKYELFIAEVHKCQLLCHDCHIEKSNNNGDYLLHRIKWQHGKSGYNNQKCRCKICKDAYKEFCKERWQKILANRAAIVIL